MYCTYSPSYGKPRPTNNLDSSSNLCVHVETSMRSCDYYVIHIRTSVARQVAALHGWWYEQGSQLLDPRERKIERKNIYNYIHISGYIWFSDEFILAIWQIKVRVAKWILILSPSEYYYSMRSLMQRQHDRPIVTLNINNFGWFSTRQTQKKFQPLSENYTHLESAV